MIVISAAVGLASAATAARVKPVPGQKLSVDEVVLIVDASSSLGANFDSQRKLAQSFADGMPSGSYKVSTLVFGGGERLEKPLSSFDRSSVEQALAADKIGKSTPLPAVLGEARDLLSGTEGKIAVVIFSDGLPTSGGRPQPAPASLTAARRLTLDHPDRICIHSIQSGDSKHGATLLRQLSAMTECGTFRTASQLQNASNLNRYQQAIFLGAAPLPAVSAAPPPMAIADFDGDGVPDARDLCAGTPSGVKVDKRGCAVINGINFALNSADIQPAYQARLNLVAATLAQNDDIRVRLTGHASPEGSDAVNATVSQARAKAIRNRLVEAGIDGSRIDVQSVGAKQARGPRDADRRVDVEFVR